MKVLVIGGGGREHALCWKLSRSPSVSEVLCAPGNAGIAEDARCIPVDAEDINGMITLADQEQPELIVIGPEVPLVVGLADQLRAKDFAVFGPGQAAAQLEGSKVFSKRLMRQAGVPTARFEIHTDLEEAEAAIHAWGAPIVIKASGLAAGKGVIVAEDVRTAITAVRDMLSGNRFGEAGSNVVLEEYLTGEEASLFFLVSGDDILPLASSQDHKRLMDGDQGPNTGGMGAYSPAACVTPEVETMVLKQVVEPTIAALKAQGIEYIGVLFCGLMMTEKGLSVLEFNVRFGDPECQTLMLRLKSDLGLLLLATARKELAGMHVDWDNDAALTVVVASDGYPGAYTKGQRIGGLDAVKAADSVVFHAGTRKEETTGDTVNAGGRVLAITARGDSVRAAAETAYTALKHLDWQGGVYRTDIGHQGVS